MNLTHHFPKDYEALRDLTIAAVGDAQSVVFQAGHFLLMYDKSKGCLVSCVQGEPITPVIEPFFEAYGHFPILTWKLALKLMAELETPQKHVMIAVNDWQYVPKDVNRSSFYTGQIGLPQVYSETLALHSDSVALLEPKPPVSNAVSTAPFYGEMNLRNRHKNRMAQLIADGKLPPSARIEESNGNVVCLLPDLSGALQEAYCTGKSADCTGEVAEMIYEATTRTGATAFVSLFPSVCRHYVELGSMRAVEIFGARTTSILNLGFPSAGVESEATLIAECEASLHLFK
ncbi:MAG: hypothetical protein EAZ42_01605 [Verrucomicrobia bacterium]|nr:MAG: hypothetical protein EAZ42_01605 [Verrucomicrobiota bacterium]